MPPVFRLSNSFASNQASNKSTADISHQNSADSTSVYSEPNSGRSKSGLRAIDLKLIRMQNCINEESDEENSPSPFFPGASGANKQLDAKLTKIGEQTPAKKRSLLNNDFRIAPKKIRTEQKVQKIESLARPRSVFIRTPLD